MSEMRQKNLLCSETSRFIYKIDLISPSLSHCFLSLVSLILNILYDPIVQSSVTYRKKSTGNQLTLNNLSHTIRSQLGHRDLIEAFVNSHFDMTPSQTGPLLNFLLPRKVFGVDFCLVPDSQKLVLM